MLERRPVFLERYARVEAGLIAQQILTTIVHPGVTILVAQFDRVARRGIPVRLDISRVLAILPEHMVFAFLLVLPALSLNVADVVGIPGDDRRTVANALELDLLHGGGV